MRATSSHINWNNWLGWSNIHLFEEVKLGVELRAAHSLTWILRHRLLKQGGHSWAQVCALWNGIPSILVLKICV